MNIKPETVIEEVVEILGLGAQNKGLDLLYQIGRDAPTQIYGDHTRLRQILINLLGNAIKFTHKGEVVIKYRGERLPSGQWRLYFSVKDTGIGIPKDKQNALFQSFSQLDVATTRKYGGTGLGLAISQRLVTMMGGEITVDSEVGKGTTFQFWIDSDAVPNADRIPPAGLKGKHLVLASPHRATLNTLTMTCDSWGVWTKATDDSDDLKEILSTGMVPDMLLIDARMVDAQRSILQYARQKFDATQLPIVVLCLPDDAVAMSKHKELGLKFLLRPLQLSRLADVIMNREPQRETGESSKSRFHAGNDSIASLHPLRILVAEDNTINQEVVIGMLEMMGYQAALAENGLEAVNAVRDTTFDIVFMDVQMPHMDGIEATKHIIADLGEQRPRIIAMTANVMQGDKESYLALGMDGYVSKPLILEEVKSVLTNTSILLGLQREAAHAAAVPSSQTTVAVEPTAQPTQPTTPPVEQESGTEVATYRYIDLHNLRELAGGDPAFMTRIINRIIDRLPTAHDELQALLADKDFDGMKKLAHSLKSSSGYAGSEELKEVFQKIESLAGSRNELQRLPPLLAEGRTIGDAVVAELQQALGRL